MVFHNHIHFLYLLQTVHLFNLNVKHTKRTVQFIDLMQLMVSFSLVLHVQIERFNLFLWKSTNKIYLQCYFSQEPKKLHTFLPLHFVQHQSNFIPIYTDIHRHCKTNNIVTLTKTDFKVKSVFFKATRVFYKTPI